MPDPPASGYYVSADGNATWGFNTDPDNPGTIADACAGLVAGETVYLRGGTYLVPARTTGNTYSGAYAPANSGSIGAPITFAAYPGETPVFDGTVVGQSAQNYFGTNGNIGVRIFGVPANCHYITFDGLTLQGDGGTTMGSMIVGANSGNTPPYLTTHIIVKNCTFNGGSGTGDWHDNAEGLRAQSVDTLLVQNCRFLNYISNGNVNPGSHYNTSGYKSYHVARVTLEHCDFSACTLAIYDKSGSDGCIYRENYIHDTPYGFYASGAGYDCINGEVSGNLLVNCAFEDLAIDPDSFDGTGTGAWAVFNNTLYHATTPYEPPIQVLRGSATRIYNNIIIGRGADYNTQVRLATNVIAEMDYNQFGTAGSPVRNEGVAYANLTAWRAALGYDLNSLENDPKFVNGSGTFSQIADFALAGDSPCKGTGKAGADMGCDVTTVGVPA